MSQNLRTAQRPATVTERCPTRSVGLAGSMDSVTIPAAFSPGHCVSGPCNEVRHALRHVPVSRTIQACWWTRSERTTSPENLLATKNATSFRLSVCVRPSFSRSHARWAAPSTLSCWSMASNEARASSGHFNAQRVTSSDMAFPTPANSEAATTLTNLRGNGHNVLEWAMACFLSDGHSAKIHGRTRPWLQWKIPKRHQAMQTHQAVFTVQSTDASGHGNRARKSGTFSRFITIWQ